MESQNDEIYCAYCGQRPTSAEHLKVNLFNNDFFCDQIKKFIEKKKDTFSI